VNKHLFVGSGPSDKDSHFFARTSGLSLAPHGSKYYCRKRAASPPFFASLRQSRGALAVSPGAQADQRLVMYSSLLQFLAWAGMFAPNYSLKPKPLRGSA